MKAEVWLPRVYSNKGEVRTVISFISSIMNAFPEDVEVVVGSEEGGLQIIIMTEV